MGLFNAYKTVNRANQLLKEMEAQLTSFTIIWNVVLHFNRYEWNGAF